jgi:sodium/potassium/calcium exchanger 2
MAVSSSIGSNIFDILVGLPVPWLIACAVKGRPVLVGAEGIGISILILLLMLVSVVVIIMLSGWRLNRKLAVMMMVLYVVFVVQDLVRADWTGGPPGAIAVCQGCREQVQCIPL